MNFSGKQRCELCGGSGYELLELITSSFSQEMSDALWRGEDATGVQGLANLVVVALLTYVSGQYDD